MSSGSHSALAHGLQMPPRTSPRTVYLRLRRSGPGNSTPPVLTLNRAELDPILATREASSPYRSHRPPQLTITTSQPHHQPPTAYCSPALPCPHLTPTPIP